MVSQHPYPLQTTLRRNLSEVLAWGASIDLVCVTERLSWGTRVPDQPGLRVYGVPLRQRRSQAFWYPIHYVSFFLWALLVVSMLAIRRRYDVVQVDTLPDFLVFAALVPRWRGTRVALYVMELMPELTVARLQLSPSARVVRLASRLERAATSWADQVITVSEPVRRILMTRGLPGGKITVVPNSHPVNHLPARRIADPPFLVIPTTLIERYGVRVAIRAFADLSIERPDLTLEVIGDGEERADLIRLADRLGLSGRVRFSPGYLPWEEMIERVGQATIGLAPILADGYGDLVLPNKILEFAAIGLPAVCSRLPIIEEYFPPDSIAYCEPGDAGSLAAQVRRLLADPEAARDQARRARLAMTDLAWESVSQRYLKVLGVATDRAPAAGTRPDHAPAV
jgi:glycosyltransferase involved in cell wall biosynthesis